MAPNPNTASDQVTPYEAAQQLAKAVIDRIDALKADLVKMQQREAEGAQALALKKSQRTVFDLAKSEDLIDPTGNAAKDRIKTFRSPKTVLPTDKKAKKLDSEGSGGDIKKDEMPVNKSGAGPAGVPAKPTGVPGAPKPPQAPGAAPTMHKMDIPTSTDKANGGPQPTKKMEIPSSTEKANGGPQPTKKMEIPTSTDKANGGPMAKSVFDMLKPKPRIGGKDMMSQGMTNDATRAAMAATPPGSGSPMGLPKQKLPTVTEHAQRAASLQGQMATGGHASGRSSASAGISLPAADPHMEIQTGASQFAHMPAGKFGKAEMDSAKCPKCKSGMSACKCYSKK